VIRVTHEIPAQNLEHHDALEAGVSALEGEVDLRHATYGDALEELVAAELLAGDTQAEPRIVEAMPRVRCQPSGASAVFPRGTSLFDAVRSLGLPLAASCDAEGVCGKCALSVRGPVDPPGAVEVDTLREQGCSPGTRLSCCVRVREDLEVRASYW